MRLKRDIAVVASEWHDLVEVKTSSAGPGDQPRLGLGSLALANVTSFGAAHTKYEGSVPSQTW